MTTTPRRGYHGGTPIAGWSFMEKPIKHIKMDDLGGAVPFFKETPMAAAGFLFF